MTELFPSNNLIDDSFQGDDVNCREVFKQTKAIQHSNEYFSAFCSNLLAHIKRHIKGIGAYEQHIVRRRRLILSNNDNDVEKANDSIPPVTPNQFYEKEKINSPSNTVVRHYRNDTLKTQSPLMNINSSLDPRKVETITQFALKSMAEDISNLQMAIANNNDIFDDGKYITSNYETYQSDTQMKEDGGLHDSVNRIKGVLGMRSEVSTSILLDVAEANKIVGLPSKGSLISQVSKLKSCLELV